MFHRVKINTMVLHVHRGSLTSWSGQMSALVRFWFGLDRFRIPSRFILGVGCLRLKPNGFGSINISINSGLGEFSVSCADS